MTYTAEAKYGSWKFDEQIVTTRHEDGDVTVERFPAFAGFTADFLSHLDLEFATIDITFRFSNGEATYRVVGTDPNLGMLAAVRQPLPYKQRIKKEMEQYLARNVADLETDQRATSGKAGGVES